MSIVEFKAKNFKSYRDEISFTMEALDSDFKKVSNTFNIPLSDDYNLQLVRSASIFGPNASGKSNLIWAIWAMVYLVRNSNSFPVGRRIVCYEPFMLDSVSKVAPVELSIIFVVVNRKYQYSISYNREEILNEELKIIIEGGEQLVFKREKGNSAFLSESIKTEILEDDVNKVLSNHLVLSDYALKEKNSLQPIYSFFDSIDIELVVSSIDLEAKGSEVAEKFLETNDTILTRRLSKLIQIADVGIQDMKIDRHGEKDFNFPDSMSEETKKRIIRENQWEFQFVHKNRDGGSALMPLRFESIGTQNLFSLGAKILNILDKGGILIYDEMNIAIHPRLFQFLVKLFHDSKSNPKNAQLIFTTHDTSIVSDNLMRADQIWFTEKSEYGETSIYSAQDFEGISMSLPFESWYRAGRFGALPKFGDVSYVFNLNSED